MKNSVLISLIACCIFHCALANFPGTNVSFADNDVQLKDTENRLDSNFNNTISQPQGQQPILLRVFASTPVTPSQPTPHHPMITATNATQTSAPLVAPKDTWITPPWSIRRWGTTAPLEYGPLLESTDIVTTLQPALNASLVGVDTAANKTPYKMGKWQSNCILINLIGTLNFSYVTKSGSSTTGFYNIPYFAHVSRSDCSSNELQTIQMSWGAADNPAWMRFEFRQWRHMAYLDMLRFVVPLDKAEFPNAMEGQVVRLIYNGRTFNTHSSQSYYCDLLETLPLTDAGAMYLDEERDSPGGTFLIDFLHFQAFRKPSDSGFAIAHHCRYTVPTTKSGLAVLCFIFTIFMTTIFWLYYQRYRWMAEYESFT